MKKIRAISLLMVLVLVSLLLVIQGPAVAQSKAPMGITPTPPIETTEPPTEPPTTEPPTTEPPTTEPPTTEAPTTEPPATEPTGETPSPAIPIGTLATNGRSQLPGTGETGINFFDEYFTGRPIRFDLPVSLSSLLLGFTFILLMPSRMRLSKKLALASLLAVSILAIGMISRASAFNIDQGSTGRVSEIDDPVSKKVNSAAIERIVIPSLKVDVGVKTASFEGETWNIESLGKDVAWLENTSLPGLGGNTVLAGHLTLKSGDVGPFRHLLYLRPGDLVQVYTDKWVYTYEVRDQYITRPRDLHAIRQTDRPQLTLLTCSHWNAAEKTYNYRRLLYADLLNVRPLRVKEEGF